jgi:hypothetical protein
MFFILVIDGRSLCLELNVNLLACLLAVAVYMMPLSIFRQEK